MFSDATHQQYIEEYNRMRLWTGEVKALGDWSDPGRAPYVYLVRFINGTDTVEKLYKECQVYAADDDQEVEFAGGKEGAAAVAGSRFLGHDMEKTKNRFAAAAQNGEIIPLMSSDDEEDDAAAHAGGAAASAPSAAAAAKRKVIKLSSDDEDDDEDDDAAAHAGGAAADPALSAAAAVAPATRYFFGLDRKQAIALFEHRWKNPVFEEMRNAITKVIGAPDQFWANYALDRVLRRDPKVLFQLGLKDEEKFNRFLIPVNQAMEKYPLNAEDLYESTLLLELLDKEMFGDGSLQMMPSPAPMDVLNSEPESDSESELRTREEARKRAREEYRKARADATAAAAAKKRRLEKLWDVQHAFGELRF